MRSLQQVKGGTIVDESTAHGIIVEHLSWHKDREGFDHALFYDRRTVVIKSMPDGNFEVLGSPIRAEVPSGEEPASELLLNLIVFFIRNGRPTYYPREDDCDKSP